MSREELNEFLDAINDALQLGPQPVEGEEELEDMPWIEAKRSVIEHYNKANIKGFDNGPMYFVFQGVRVYEQGKRKIAKEREKSLEERNFGGRSR